MFLWNARSGSKLPLNDPLTILYSFINLSYVKVIGCCYRSATLFLITQLTLPASPSFTLFWPATHSTHVNTFISHEQPHFQLEWIESSQEFSPGMCTNAYSLKTSISQTIAIQLFLIAISWQLKLKNKMLKILNHQFCHCIFSVLLQQPVF